MKTQLLVTIEIPDEFNPPKGRKGTTGKPVTAKEILNAADAAALGDEFHDWLYRRLITPENNEKEPFTITVKLAP